jgi:hypothetical protein
VVTEQDLETVRQIVAENPGASRLQLSLRLCEAWGWVQPNGQPRDMVCRSFMLGLHRAGLIALPPVRFSPPNNAIARRPPLRVEVDCTPLRTTLGELGALEIRQVRGSSEDRLVDGLIHGHHYLGYKRPVGEHLKYLVYAGERPIACLIWCSAPRHLGPRDRFIGWSKEARRRNVRLLAYNTRYLILPWVNVPHLASHVLGRMARTLSADWEQTYAHPIYFLETFTDPARYRGTCYRAANWVVLGRTTGRGNNAPTHEPRVPVKEILAYPLTPRFREILGRIE